MKVRKVLFKNFRNFRGLKEISFVDPLTNEPRPLTVLVGSNGTGKTTILDSIEGMLMQIFAYGFPQVKTPIIREALEKGYIGLEIQLTADDLNGFQPQSLLFRLGVGRLDELHSLSQTEKPDWEWVLDEQGEFRTSFGRNLETGYRLYQMALAMNEGRVQVFGGLIYFPHYRNLLPRLEGGPIQPPPQQKLWLYRFEPSSSWQGSLEQFLVWQNYLDLEAGNVNRDNLSRFLTLIRDVLGKEREIIIKQGRVLVRPSWAIEEGADEWVRIDQLPSGEQQVFYLFGELARQLRKGAIVMIDEPEISLHPTLQRLVVHKLRQLAEEWDLQIILATHSLEIVRAVSRYEVVNLDYLAEVSTATVEGAVVE